MNKPKQKNYGPINFMRENFS